MKALLLNLHTIPDPSKRIMLRSFSYIFACFALTTLGWVGGPSTGLAQGQFNFDEPAQFNINDAVNGGLSLPTFGADEKKVEFEARYLIEEGSRRGILSVKASLADHWHMYSVSQPKGGPLRTVIKLRGDSDKVLELKGAFEPDRDPISRDRGFSVPAEEHDDEVIWTAPIELVEGANPKTGKVELSVDGQVCAEACVKVSEKVKVAFGGLYKVKTSPVSGEFNPSRAHAKIVGYIKPATVAPGQMVTVHLKAEIAEGYHLYAYSPASIKDGPRPTLIAFSKLSGLTVSKIDASAEPHLGAPDPTTGKKPLEHEGEVEWTVQLKVPADATPGSLAIVGGIGFATCFDKGCDPPTAATFNGAVTVAETAGAGIVAPLAFNESTYGNVAKLTDQTSQAQIAENGVGEAPEAAVAATEGGAADSDAGQGAYGAMLAPVTAWIEKTKAESPTLYYVGQIGYYSVLGLLGGLLLNIMPCVLPVIGLKIMSFTEQAKGKRSEVFFLNLWYSLGILAFFVGFATLVVFLDFGWGRQFTLTWFKVSISCLVFAMALSFLGVWEIPIPGFASGKVAQNLQEQSGGLGAFNKGIFTTILATPCGAPLMAGALGFVSDKPFYIVYLVYGCVGLGMALPYLTIGVFPKLISFLPKPGLWMDTVKQLLSFLLLAMVLYFFRAINPQYWFATLTLLFAVWFACWWIGKISYTAEWHTKVLHWSGALATAGMIGFVAFVYFANPLPSQAGGNTAVATAHAGEDTLPWRPYSEAALAEARQQGKTVMIDFTANWCANCQWNTAYAIETDDVRNKVEANNVVTLLADWTDSNAEIEQKLSELNSPSIPFLAIYPAGKSDADVIRLPNLISEKQLLESLEKAGPSKSSAQDSTATAMRSQS